MAGREDRARRCPGGALCRGPVVVQRTGAHCPENRAVNPTEHKERRGFCSSHWKSSTASPYCSTDSSGKSPLAPLSLQFTLQQISLNQLQLLLLQEEPSSTATRKSAAENPAQVSRNPD